MRTLFFIFLLLPTVILAQKGDRIFAWQIDVAENDNYDSAWAQAENACMESTHFFVTWADLEPDTGMFDSNTVSGYLDIIDLYLSIKNMPMEFVVAPINTVKREVPNELETVAFDNPNMIRLFKRALDTIFFHLQNVELTAFNIGNESDVYFGGNPTAYAEYKTFLDSVVPHAKALYQQYHGKDIKVGTTLTHTSLVNSPGKALCQSLNAGLDIVSATYYPLNPDFTMKAPSVVEEDFDSLVSAYPDTNQPIYFVECGYSSSPVCNSSEELQAEFFQNVFDAWDKHQANIKYLSVFKLTDWSLERVQELKTYYGINDTIFLEYLHGLGVRTWKNDGSDKDAMYVIKCELDERNWCNVNCPSSGIKDETSSNIQIYPNPNYGFLNLDFDYIPKRIELELYDINGLLVESYSPKTISKIHQMNLDVPGGFYILKVYTERESLVKRLIKI